MIDKATLQVSVPREWLSLLDAEVVKQGFRTLDEYVRALIVEDSRAIRDLINSGRRRKQHGAA
ncbi:hypothetical protein [Burkholderia gladioli]|uniref:hypothetical protein n=1 Tax=Burkholderia gladioli TaxID=28095 RepID=UPI0028563B0B|nr:hypothetical protein [Burkholderia gladioli]MDR8091073.1 hypothetical protein [Burkholderia gladioli]